MTTEAKICLKCKEYRTGHYCSECGTKLQDIPKCTCGERIIRRDKYCSFCGKKVDKKLYYGWPVKG